MNRQDYLEKGAIKVKIMTNKEIIKEIEKICQLKNSDFIVSDKKERFKEQWRRIKNEMN